MIDSARDLLDTELTALSGESYQRAYGAMVSVQMLAELEEVIQYKALPERRAPIRKMWWQRLQVSHLVSFDPPFPPVFHSHRPRVDWHLPLDFPVFHYPFMIIIDVIASSVVDIGINIVWFHVQGCQRIVEDWQKIIQVHSLVVSPEEDMRTWLKYSSLCRKSGRLVNSLKFQTR